MSSKPLTLVHGILIVTVTLLAPGVGRGQDQNPAPAAETQQPEAKPEKAAEQPAASPAAAPAPATAAGTAIAPPDAKPNAEATAAAAPTAVETAETYVVRQGDTLWGISNALLKDPFLWPFLWKANPFITNADLIYPGQKLTIPSMAPIERAMAAPAAPEPERHAEQAAEPAPAPAPVVARPETASKAAAEEPAVQNRLILPEEKPIPLFDKYSMLNAGFVSSEESSDRIIGSVEGKTILGTDDMVYVRIKSKEDAEIGSRYIIYEPLDTVKHPVTGRKYGKLTRVLGVLQLVERGKNDYYTGRIVFSFDAAAIGNRLTPYQDPTLIYKAPEPKQKDLSGYILQVVDGRTINAQIDVVYLDKGSTEGVEPGDRFLVYSKGIPSSYPRKLVGEVQVFLVKEETATAVVRKSTDTLVRGDIIEYKK